MNIIRKKNKIDITLFLLFSAIISCDEATKSNDDDRDGNNTDILDTNASSKDKDFGTSATENQEDYSVNDGNILGTVISTFKTLEFEQR